MIINEEKNLKLIRNYITVIMICASLTFCAAGILSADESARRVVLGEQNAVLVLNSTGRSPANAAEDISPILRKAAEITEKAVLFAPPPISNIYWFFN